MDFEGLFLKLGAASRESNKLPDPTEAQGDFEFYLTDPVFKEKTESIRTRLLKLLNGVMKFERPSFQYFVDSDDPTERFEEVVDTLDNIYEKIVNFILLHWCDVVFN